MEDPHHITEQRWVLEERADGDIYLIGEDGTPIVKLCRPDRGSDILIAGYLVGLQLRKLAKEK